MSSDTPIRMRGALIGPLREPDGVDQEAVAEAIAEIEDPDETEVVYAPAGVPSNHYDPHFDQVVLDERLTEWPDVHRRIREHELRHAEYGAGLIGTARQAALELRTDLFLHWSTSDDADRVREYLDERGQRGESAFRERASFALVNTLRSLWLLVVLPLGALYRRLRRFGGDQS